MDRLQELLVIVGGRSKTAFIETVFTLDLEKLVWTQIRIKPKEDHT